MTSPRRMVILLVVLSIVTSGIASGQVAEKNLSISLDAPAKAQVNQQITISTTVSVPDIQRDVEKELTVTLSIDGQQVATKTVTVQDGEQTSISFSHTFESSGTHTIKATGEVTLIGQTYSKSVSATIEVRKPDTPETPQKPDIQATSLSGAAFTLPKSLEDEVNSYRSQTGKDLAPKAFVLATRDDLYIVFTSKEPEKGLASVVGPQLSRDISYKDLTFGVIAATSASFDQDGTQASVSDISQNAKQYRLKLVEVTATHRHLSVLYDPDKGQSFTFISTTGVLVENPRTAAEMFKNVGQKARTLNRNPNSNKTDNILQRTDKPQLYTFSFEKQFWTDTEMTIDGIVLSPSSAARKYIKAVDQTKVVHGRKNEPLLYVVKKQLDAKSVESVQQIKTNAASLEGEVVTVEARLYQQRISTQETIEHSTGCGNSLTKTQDSCVNIPIDTLLHGGVAWNSVPTSRDGVLFVMGVSSQHQDSPSELTKGRYQITGEVVSTSRVDESLPSGSILLIYDLKRTGDINYRQVAKESRAIIESRSQEVTTRLRTQLLGDSGQLPAETATVRKKLKNIEPGKPAVVTFTSTERTGGVNRIRLIASASLQNIQVSVTPVNSLPSSVKQPPGTSLRTLNISTSASDDNIKSATFEITLNKSEVPQEATLVVYRYHDGAWNAMNTSVVAESQTTITLKVTTPGFSYFAVGTQSTENETQEPTAQNGGDSREQTSGSGPGFRIVTTLIALLGGILLFRFRS